MAIEHPIILYEGAEDHAFLSELLAVLGLSKNFVFHLNKKGEPDCAGKDGFGKILVGIVSGSVRHKQIIIVADNDGNPAEAFKNVQNQIGRAGFVIPQKPREIVETPNLPPLTMLMIPWDNETGCLETLCLSAANTKYSKQLACADALVKCAGEAWDVAHKSKLRMRGFLSAICKTNPNTGLRFAWKNDNGRPGDIFPIKGVAAYNQIAQYFKNLAA